MENQVLCSYNFPMNSKAKFKTIYNLLKSKYGNLNSSLNFTNEVECWSAVLLSVQNTDKHINTVTTKLFAKFKTFEDYANSSTDEIYEYVKAVNYNNTKAKYLLNGANMICSEFAGKLPTKLDELMRLPGVGRKVGNVILSEMNNVSEGIAIDTHNLRAWNRILDITSPESAAYKNLSAKKLEELLMKNLDRSIWREISLLVIEHGRNICKAQKPKCEECLLKSYCAYYMSEVSGQKIHDIPISART